MQYSPRLKKIMEEIKEILVENDIAGAVVIQEPGFSEYAVHFRPSWSCLEWEDNQVRFKAKLEDFGGDREKRDKTIADTLNMIHHLGESSGIVSKQMVSLENFLKTRIKFDHFGGGHSSHTAQNN
jgi:hypothetical protein